tara:strand:+ start:689 stop:1723 length:1035 start_codon:yes stop_codon:yes gene_type:complete
MNEIYTLNSILNAIEDINTRPKNKSNFSKKINSNKINSNKINTSFSENENLLPITEKLILEAEKHANSLKNKLSTSNLITPKEDILILDNEYNNQHLIISSLEEIKGNIINDLYNSMSKKVKKKTLKTIFDLRYKIKNLEKEILDLNNNSINHITTDSNINNFNETAEHIINENYAEDEKKSFDDLEDGKLSVSVIETLKLQDSLIKNFEKNEENLRLKITDLEQDLSIFKNKKTNHNKNLSDNLILELTNNLDGQIKETNIASNIAVNKAENLTDQFQSKILSETSFYRENYERLVVENNEIKKRFKNLKEQITTLEETIKEFESVINNLNNILSKNSIIKLK